MVRSAHSAFRGTAAWPDSQMAHLASTNDVCWYLQPYGDKSDGDVVIIITVTIFI